MTSAPSGVPDAPGGDTTPGAEIEVPDELHRRVARTGPDGRVVEVLAARRGVTMRPGPFSAAGAGGGDLNPLSMVFSLVLELVVSIVATAFAELAADQRPWKVRAYRRGRFLVRRLHAEVLPPGVDPEVRMRELLDRYAPMG